MNWLLMKMMIWVRDIEETVHEEAIEEEEEIEEVVAET
jgi:hypothetical protein